MKHLLLFLSFVFSASFVAAQTGDNKCGNCSDNNSSYGNHSNQNLNPAPAKKPEVMIFPNPATEFIGIKGDSEQVKNVSIFSLVGKKMKDFVVLKDETFPVTDLPEGMYMVQFLGFNNKVVSTQRLNIKKS